MSDRTYYVICDDNCRFEGMTKEEIYDAIAEATGSTPTPVDTAFITQIKEQNAQASLKVWKGTEAQFNALASKTANTIYFIGTDEIRNYDDEIETLTDSLNDKADASDLGYTALSIVDEMIYADITKAYQVTDLRLYDALDLYVFHIHLKLTIGAGQTVTAGTALKIGSIKNGSEYISDVNRQALTAVTFASTSNTNSRSYNAEITAAGDVYVRSATDMTGGTEGTTYNIGISGTVQQVAS